MQEQCNGNRDWYHQVKEESEKSVETAVYNQMCRIKDLGDYKIGSAKEDVHYDIHEVISLIVRDQKGERCYSLAELQELQSKLLLTTKSDTEKRKFVDTFSDVRFEYLVMPICQYMHNGYLSDNTLTKSIFAKYGLCNYKFHNLFAVSYRITPCVTFSPFDEFTFIGDADCSIYWTDAYATSKSREYSLFWMVCEV